LIMRASGKITDKDRDEIRKFMAFQKAWDESKLRTLSDPEFRRYLNLTPAEAWEMMMAIRKKERAKR
jgi:hypothetical protein